MSCFLFKSDRKGTSRSLRFFFLANTALASSENLGATIHSKKILLISSAVAVSTSSRSRSPSIQQWVGVQDVVLRVSKLCDTLQDHLVRNQPPLLLVRLPRPVIDVVKHAGINLPYLSPKLLCEHLRRTKELGPLMQADNVNELLRFVVTHAVHKGNASSFFTMLKGVRLQKLGSGKRVSSDEDTTRQ